VIWLAVALAIAALLAALYVQWASRREPDPDLADAIEQLKIVVSLQLVPVLRRLTAEVNNLWGEDKPSELQLPPRVEMTDEEAEELRQEWLRKQQGGR
jgi:hypothetical protein